VLDNQHMHPGADLQVSKKSKQTADADEAMGRPPIHFTIFPDIQAATKEDHQAADLDDLAELVRGACGPSKEELPWLKLQVFGDAPSAKGCLRHDANVLAISGCEGDYDAKAKPDGTLMTIEEAAGRCREAGVEALLYETPSATSERPRWRVICPVSQAYPGDKTALRGLRAELVARLNRVLDGVLAGESFNLSQSFYFGNVEGKPSIQVIVVEGQPIDQLNGIEPLYKNGSNMPEAPRAAVEAPQGLIESADDRALLAEIGRQIALYKERNGIGETPTGTRAFDLICWCLKLRVGNKIIEPEALQEILAEQWRDVEMDTIENALKAIGSERGAIEFDREPEPARRSAAEMFAVNVAAEPARSTEEGWSEPIDLFGRIAPEPVLTRDMLPPVIADYAFDVAERIGVDPGVVACAMLATSAAAIDDGIQIQPKVLDSSWLESARLNFLIAAPVGAAKTPAMKAATKPLREIDAKWQKEDARKIAQWEDDANMREAVRKLVEKEVRRNGKDAPEAQNPLPLRPERPLKRRLVINDTTTEGVARILKDNPRGMLLEVDEAMGWISSFDVYRNGSAGKDRAFWLQADNGGHYAKDRADEKASFLVPNLSVSIIGGIQPEKLRSIAKDLHDDGLIQRAFVIIAGAGKRGVDREPNRQAEKAYAALLARLVEMHPMVPPRGIELDFDAQCERDIVEDLAEAFIDLPTTPAAFKQHLAKWPGRFARLLLLFHVIDGGTEPYVSGETAARVKDFMVRYLLPQQHRFYAEYFRGIRPVEADMEWIAGYILAHHSDEVTAREIKRGNHAMTDDSIPDAMKVLTDANWLGQPVEDRAKRSISWPVNPRVHFLFAERAAAERQRREETKRVIAEAASKVKAAGYQ